MKYDFKKVNVLDIKWKKISYEWKLEEAAPYKRIANLIYIFSKDLELCDIARDIYSWKEVELRDKEIEEIKNLLEHKQSDMASFYKRAILQYIDSVKWKNKH